MCRFGVFTNSTSGSPHAGSYYAWLDGYGTTHTDTLSQIVTVPAATNFPVDDTSLTTG